VNEGEDLDKIIIKDLEVFAHHGVLEGEREVGQKFLISLEVFVNRFNEEQNDELEHTVNYVDICSFVEHIFTEHKYNLIETCAVKLSESILLKFPSIRRVDVVVKKPWAPIGKPLDYAAVEVSRCWHNAFLSVGSNLGDKEKNIREAIEMLNDNTTRVKKVSGLITTKPVGYLDQDDFLNGCIEVVTLKSPHELLKQIQSIEANLKRERKIRWGPRTIDLDIVLYDQEIVFSDDLVIPHPRMHERLFVLEPLEEIAPYLIHPVFNKSIAQLRLEKS